MVLILIRNMRISSDSEDGLITFTIAEVVFQQ
jgi:hypothetical protein